MLSRFLKSLKCCYAYIDSIRQSLVILRTFRPVKVDLEKNVLYAEFSDSFSTNIINQYVTKLRPGQSVTMYVPHSLYHRYRAVCEIAHSYRHGEVKHKTKIKYGISDFMLMVKPRDSISSWTYVSLNSLPPLELSSYVESPSSSPPQGRQRLPSKRPRSLESPEVNDKLSRARTDQPTPPPATEDNDKIANNEAINHLINEDTTVATSNVPGTNHAIDVNDDRNSADDSNISTNTQQKVRL